MSWSVTDDADQAGTVEVTMPETGSGHGATVVAWLKRPGERVQADEAICRVAWDEITAEISSPAAGVLRMLAVASGEAAATGTPLAVIDVGVKSPLPGPALEPFGALEPESGLEPQPVADPEVEIDAIEIEQVERDPIEIQPHREPEPVEPEPAPVEPEPAPTPEVEVVAERLLRDAPVSPAPPVELGGFLSPAVRRFVREHEIDPDEVDGTGRDGRVRLDDVRPNFGP